MERSFSDYVIANTSTLKEALIKMTASHKGVLLVADKEYKLLGILSDGDVRRALINDVSLSVPVEQIMNLNPVVAKDEQQAGSLLQAKQHLLLLPVVDNNGVLVGIYSGVNEERYIKNDTHTDDIYADSADAAPQHKVLAIVPARGGSKRLPQKNLSRIGNDSLVGLAIKAGRSSEHIDHIYISTDSEDIAAEAKANGLDVPWLRPADLATDTAKSVDVMIHATEQFKAQFGYLPEMVVLLEPTAPLRTGRMLDMAIELFRNNKEADSLVSVNLLRHNFHPEEVLKDVADKYVAPYLGDRTFDNRKLRGGQDKAYVQNGLVYIVKTDVLLGQRSIYGSKVLKYETAPELFCDIDDNEDLKLAVYKMKNL